MPKKPTKDAFEATALLIDLEATAYNTKFKPNALYDVMNKINDDGLPVLLAHDSGKMPVGSWYKADVVNQAVHTTFFIPKEVSEYDDIKTRIDADILDSVSIGFNAGTHECSICGYDIHDYRNCDHIPGKTYAVENSQAGVAQADETCYVLLDDVKASEASLVYSGAVPAAKIFEAGTKEEFFNKNKMNFAKGDLETVHSAKFVQDLNVNKNKPEGDNMDKEAFAALTTKHEELNTKFTDVNDKYNTAREANIDLKEKNLEFKEKVDGYDAAVEAQAAADLAFTETRDSLAERVEALAAPFDVDYKAPESIKDILTDLDTYMEKTKALPSGRQSVEEDLVYSEPDSNFKV